MGVIAQCAAPAGIHDSGAPVLNDDITAWSEFKAMRDIIQAVGERQRTGAAHESYKDLRLLVCPAAHFSRLLLFA